MLWSAGDSSEHAVLVEVLEAQLLFLPTSPLPLLGVKSLVDATASFSLPPASEAKW